MYSKISGTGSYLPEKILTNHDIEKIVETSDSWIQDRTGIKSRHIAAEDQTTTQIAAAALEQALAGADKKATDLDLIVVATCTADSKFPSTATQLQKQFDVYGFPAFDINAACSGFIYALSIVDSMIKKRPSTLCCCNWCRTYVFINRLERTVAPASYLVMVQVL